MKRNWKKFWKLGVDEFNTQFFGLTKEGELTVSEGNYVYTLYDLVKKYGSPAKIYFPSVIEHRLRDLIEYFNAYIKINGYKGKFFYHYPMKVNQNREVVLPLVAEGAHLEVTSANELYLVKKLWEGDKFHTKLRVLCNGPKTEEYIGLIFELRSKGLNIIPIIETEGEMIALEKYKGDIGVRVDLSIKADTHWDKKVNRFGLSEKRVLELPKMKNLKLLHYHIGSQVRTQKSLLDAVRRGFYVYSELVKKHPSLDTLDIGGGFSVPYEKKKLYMAKTMANKIVRLLKMLADKAQIRHPNIAVEWGQYIVAPSQVTVYKVIAEKEIAQATAKAWYIVDGSFMNDLTDTWAIHQKWHVVPVNNATRGEMQRVWLAGSTCDSDDKYTAGGNYILMPKLKEGEDQYVAVFDTGAYQESLASHHCLLSQPAKLLAQDGSIKIIRKKETADSIGKLFGWNTGEK
jgi:arginine decarboxylase